MADAAVSGPATDARWTLLARYGQFFRFLLVGGSNTLVTLALFVVLQRWLSPGVAYTVVFLLGLAYTTVLTASVVFGSRLTWRRAAAFVGWYLLVYAVGLGVVQLVAVVWAPSSLTTAVVTVAATAPLNFLGGRLLFAVRPPSAPPA